MHEDEDILLITDDGTIIRMPVSSIRVCGRVAQGVRLMRVGDERRIISVCRAEAEETAVVAEPDESSGLQEDDEYTEQPDPNETDNNEI